VGVGVGVSVSAAVEKLEWTLKSTATELTQPWKMDIEAYTRQWFGGKCKLV
jgi:hypothetical protein